MDIDTSQHRVILQRITRKAMFQRGLFPDFSPEALLEPGRIQVQLISVNVDRGYIDFRKVGYTSHGSR
ncbi:MAG: hypothetical protein C0402_15600 [Thermodesulfovibrio sp.]|nr:hypothetical protein [Thermodesulfovibrio sp.]